MCMFSPARDTTSYIPQAAGMGLLFFCSLGMTTDSTHEPPRKGTN